MVFGQNFLQLLQSKSFVNVFNPYTDHCALYDLPKAAEIRSFNLLNYVKQMGQNKPGIIWIAEALGHRGGRRTGIAMTDDLHLVNLSNLQGIHGLRSACTNILKEITASHIWSQLKVLSTSNLPFLWNIFPFHPHRSGEPISNRSLISNEISETEDIVHCLFDFFNFDKILSIGKKSLNRLENMGYDPIYVRHPSHGGSKIFREQIREIYLLD